MMGCCCGGGCIAFTDNFTRDNSDTVGNGWTEALGNWRITSNSLRVDAAIPQYARLWQEMWTMGGGSSYHDINPPDTVTTTVESSVDGDEVGLVYFGHPAFGVQSQRFNFVLLKVGAAAELRVYRWNGGAPEQVGETAFVTAAVDTPHTIKICGLASYPPGNQPASPLSISLNGQVVFTEAGIRLDPDDPFADPNNPADYVSNLEPIAAYYSGPIVGNVTGVPKWTKFIVDWARNEYEPGETSPTEYCYCDHCFTGNVDDDFDAIDPAWQYTNTTIRQEITIDNGKLDFSGANAGITIDQHRCHKFLLNGFDVEIELPFEYDAFAVAQGAIEGIRDFRLHFGLRLEATTIAEVILYHKRTNTGFFGGPVVWRIDSRVELSGSAGMDLDFQSGDVWILRVTSDGTNTTTSLKRNGGTILTGSVTHSPTLPTLAANSSGGITLPSSNAHGYIKFNNTSHSDASGNKDYIMRVPSYQFRNL